MLGLRATTKNVHIKSSGATGKRPCKLFFDSADMAREKTLQCSASDTAR